MNAMLKQLSIWSFFVTKIWIDDERPAPDDSWLVAKTSREALYLLRSVYATMVGLSDWAHITYLEEVSFDHDLGGEDTTRPVMLWMAEYGIWPKRVVVHTANPVGKIWLLGTARQWAPENCEIRAG